MSVAEVRAEIDAAIAGRTVAQMFAEIATARGEATALRWKDGDDWRELSWTGLADQACRVAASLSEMGVGRGDRVMLMLRNRPEFHVADLGILLVGATPISIYNSSAPDQIEYLVGHSEAKVAIVDDIEFLERLLKVRPQLGDLTHTLVVDDPDGLRPDDVALFTDLLKAAPVDLESAARVAQPDDLATVIYTSGTTGPPKGVMLDHANIMWELESALRMLGHKGEGWREVSYLPMAHIAERTVGYYLPILGGWEVTTCPEPSAVAGYLKEVRPQFFFAVPRIWEKFAAALRAGINADPDKAAQMDQALEVGWQVSELNARGEEIPAELAAAHEQADVGLRAVRGMIGLDQCEMAGTGAAPIPYDVLKFFRSIGVPISEVWGLSETTGGMTWSTDRPKIGTVGPAYPGGEIKLADDGEVLCRGGNIFRGYLKSPEKTAEVLIGDGWFATGDIGEIDDDGYLSIVDRKKELIITAGGKNISPANIESRLKEIPLIGQACVIGDGRKYMSALLVLDPDTAPAWAAAQGIEGGAAEIAALAENDEVKAAVDAGVAEVNSHFTHVEGLKRWAVLGEEWLPDTELLTPTMKLKRRGIHQHYAELIDSLYE